VPSAVIIVIVIVNIVIVIVANSSSKAFGISFADRPKAKRKYRLATLSQTPSC
jgi:hypothetical protein